MCSICKRAVRVWRGVCKECRAAALTPEAIRARNSKYHQKWRRANLSKARESVRRYHQEHREELKRDPRRQKRRLAYQQMWQRANPEKMREYSQRYAATHPDRAANVARWRRIRLAQPERRLRYLITAAKNRAKHRGFPFEDQLFEVLTKIPTTCAYCGAPLDYSYVPRTHSERHRARSPSLDRIDNTVGYTVQNVAVTCSRCNYIKSDATLDDLRMLAAAVERELRARGLLP